MSRLTSSLLGFETEYSPRIENEVMKTIRSMIHLTNKLLVAAVSRRINQDTLQNIFDELVDF